MMDGVLTFLTSESCVHPSLGNHPVALSLRSLYVFKVVPMLNPEGVLCGNFRCTLTGTDLNRRWDQPNERLHGPIFNLKQLLRKLVGEGKQILVCCDMHGHSRKHNSFMYGCNRAADGGFSSWTKVRLLPRILARKTALFSYPDCRFRVEGDKQRTARVVIWKEFAVTNSFTLESSFYGYARGDQVSPYLPEDHRALGRAFLLALLEYHELLKEIERELASTRGWLKPSKLIALTGTPAAVHLAEQIAQQKEAHKRQERISRIQNLLHEKKERASIYLLLSRRVSAQRKSQSPSPS